MSAASSAEPAQRWRSLGDPALVSAALALHDNRLSEAERGLKGWLKDHPFDVTAIRMLAELAGRLGRNRDAETLLRRALELSPGFGAARANLATVLYRLNRPVEALAELDVLADAGDGDVGQDNLRAAALGRLGGFDEAIALYETVLARAPEQPKVWMSLGHMVKTVGRQAEAVIAYRRALRLAPSLGEVWWSLANLKTVAFDATDIVAMETALARRDISDEDRFHLDFALGKAFDDIQKPEAAFAHYVAGNRLRRSKIAYDPAETSRVVDRTIALCDGAFFADRARQGSAARDPIFVLGMPRAGSTLVEQILASHSQVEGTSELSDIAALARPGPAYPDRLAELSPDNLRDFGEAYLERTRVQRREGTPRFIDKMPNNWLHLPFVALTLPNATIIDARRHPLDCCVSNFRQHFARGQGFSYDLAEMGAYYRDYVRLMAHIDAVLPGRVYRVIHEWLIDDTESEVRALLARCGLDFEAACLSFHETARAVRTASSEQVRRPINRDGVGSWRRYEAWLQPLRDALGDVIETYPA